MWQLPPTLGWVGRRIYHFIQIMFRLAYLIGQFYHVFMKPYWVGNNRIEQLYFFVKPLYCVSVPTSLSVLGISYLHYIRVNVS
jgi:hypothetical protein